MKMPISTHHAAEILASDENAKWSRAGAFALVEYLEGLEESTGEEIEFDRVAIRCDWSEYPSLIDWAFEHCGPYVAEKLNIESFDESDECDATIREYIEARGTLIEFEGGVIVSAF